MATAYKLVGVFPEDVKTARIIAEAGEVEADAEKRQHGIRSQTFTIGETADKRRRQIQAT